MFIKPKDKWERAVVRVLRDYIECDVYEDNDGVWAKESFKRIMRIVKKAQKEAKDEGARNPYC